MGVLTTAFGGVIRDVLAEEPNLLLRREIYITAALLGASVFAVLQVARRSVLAGRDRGVRRGVRPAGCAIKLGWSLPGLRAARIKTLLPLREKVATAGRRMRGRADPAADPPRFAAHLLTRKGRRIRYRGPDAAEPDHRSGRWSRAGRTGMSARWSIQAGRPSTASCTTGSTATDRRRRTPPGRSGRRSIRRSAACRRRRRSRVEWRPSSGSGRCAARPGQVGDRTVTSAPNGPAKAFWHMRQWQIEARPGSPSTRKRTAPHWQPPVRRQFERGVSDIGNLRACAAEPQAGIGVRRKVTS
jgi:hypothetical protein